MTSTLIHPSHDRCWQDRFLQLLPGIQQYALLVFRHLRAEAREDAVAEVVASTLVAFVGLVERGRMISAYVTVLARYGVARHLAGRRVGARTNSRDITSPVARRKHGVQRIPLAPYDPGGDFLETMAVEDRTAGRNHWFTCSPDAGTRVATLTYESPGKVHHRLSPIAVEAVLGWVFNESDFAAGRRRR